MTIKTKYTFQNICSVSMSLIIFLSIHIFFLLDYCYFEGTFDDDLMISEWQHVQYFFDKGGMICASVHYGLPFKYFCASHLQNTPFRYPMCQASSRWVDSSANCQQLYITLYFVFDLLLLIKIYIVYNRPNFQKFLISIKIKKKLLVIV